MLKKGIFLCLFLVSIFMTSAWALVLGIAVAIFIGNPFAKIQRLQTLLLQTSVVGLGAGMNLVTVLKQGAAEIPSTLIALILILSFGLWISRRLGLTRNLGWLLASGTAICGGSAIAAVAPTIEAKSEETSTALGVVFLLNSIALVLFPSWGMQWGMSQHQFGVFAALAIHDTSSVVGAASQYGAEALAIATPTKLVRALWILPLCAAIAYMRKLASQKNSAKKGTFPRFILFFLAMSAAATWLPNWGIPTGLFYGIHWTAKHTLVGAIFLIGTALNLQNLRALGPRVLVAGIALWAFSIAISLQLSR